MRVRRFEPGLGCKLDQRPFEVSQLALTAWMWRPIGNAGWLVCSSIAVVVDPVLTLLRRRHARTSKINHTITVIVDPIAAHISSRRNRALATTPYAVVVACLNAHLTRRIRKSSTCPTLADETRTTFVDGTIAILIATVAFFVRNSAHRILASRSAPITPFRPIREADLDAISTHADIPARH
jgi:hypothetical protein